jgi:hypothetical protein
VIGKAMAKDPAERYSTVVEMGRPEGFSLTRRLTCATLVSAEIPKIEEKTYARSRAAETVITPPLPVSKKRCSGHRGLGHVILIGVLAPWREVESGY